MMAKETTCGAPIPLAIQGLAPDESGACTLRVLPSECGSHTGETDLISKFGHGGPRKNSGGARPGAGRKPKGDNPAMLQAQPEGVRWYCIQTFPMREQAVCRDLCDLDLDHHLPLFVDRSGDKPVHRPLFSGYVFVLFDCGTDPWRKLVSLSGVRRLFSTSAERPIPIPVGVVENLKACGMIDEPDDAPWLEPIRVGHAVRILSGPFAGLEGICHWSTSQRTRLLIELFSGSVPLDMAREDIAPI